MPIISSNIYSMYHLAVFCGELWRRQSSQSESFAFVKV